VVPKYLRQFSPRAFYVVYPTRARRDAALSIVGATGKAMLVCSTPPVLTAGHCMDLYGRVMHRKTRTFPDSASHSLISSLLPAAMQGTCPVRLIRGHATVGSCITCVHMAAA
jgi:hypothetical protein